MKKATSIFLCKEVFSEDVNKMALWLQNHHVTRYLNEDDQIVEKLHSLLTDVPHHLLRYHFNRFGHFFLVRMNDQNSIGFLTLQEWKKDCYEIVFVIGDESLWGNGYGYQLVLLAESEVFLKLRAQSLTAKIYHENKRSVHVVHNCGFREAERFETLSSYRITMEEYLVQLADKQVARQRLS